MAEKSDDKEGSNISFRPGKTAKSKPSTKKRHGTQRSKEMVTTLKKYGRKGPPLLQKNQFIMKNLKIVDLIGGGGYGQIYKAFHVQKDQYLAVKVEPKDHDPGRMVQEQEILKKLNGTPNSPTLVGAGKFENIHFFVMELLGPSLSELRKKQRQNRFSISTTMRAVLQAFTAIQTLHNVGYVHRDVKPSNLCIGNGPQRRTIYLVDFGLSRSIYNKDGKMRSPRRRINFRGTMKYVSLNMHMKKEQGPVDDYICLFYSTVEMNEGQLPWKNIKDAKEVEKSKRFFNFEKFCKCTPTPFKKFYTELEKLSYRDKIDYELFLHVIKECIPEGVNEFTPYDWEEAPTQLSDG